MSKVIFDSPTIQVIEWRAGQGKGGVMIGPPDAGHGDAILNYAPGKSIVQEALNNTEGGVHSIRWKGATFATRNTSIEDKVQDTLRAMKVSGSRHLIGLCQAGWLFSLVATRRPDAVDSLTIAGSPIDTSLGESVIQPAMEMALWKYKLIVAANWGIMPGWLMLACWKSGNPKMHYEDRYLDPQEDTDLFYSWYDNWQHLAGDWFLEIIESLFLNNTFKDDLWIQCPAHIATGTRDDITPPEQSWALANYCQNSIDYYECDTKHLGVFLGSKARPMWAEIFQHMGV